MSLAPSHSVKGIPHPDVRGKKPEGLTPGQAELPAGLP